MYPDNITHVGISVGPTFPVRPERYAGIERDTADLAVALAEQGMDVHVMASGDSRIAEEHPNIALHPIVPVSIGKLGLNKLEYQEAEAHALFRTLDIIRDLGGRSMDVLDLRWEHPGIVPNIQKMGFRHGLPIIASLSCRPNAYVRAVEEHRYNEAINIHPTALSNAHRLALMAASRGDHFGMKRDIDVMPFGVSFKEASFSADSLAQSKETPENPLLRALQNSGKDYFLHAASINKEKGQSSTITLFKEAQKAGLDDAVLVLAGTPDKQSPDAMDYWRTEIEPHIDRNGVIYVGELNEAEKWEYMKFARATIFCSGIEARYVEAYGRVLAESAGSGAPVVGIKSNTFREIMEEGITGLGFTTIAEGAQKLLDVALLNRTRCKEYAREHMSNDRFVMQMGKLCTYMAETRKYFYRSYEDERPFPTYQPDISYVERGKDADPYEAYEELRCGWRYAHVSTAPHHASRYSVGSRLAETSVSLVDHYGLDLSLSSDEAWRFVDGCKYSCKGHSFFDGYMATSG